MPEVCGCECKSNFTVAIDDQGIFFKCDECGEREDKIDKDTVLEFWDVPYFDWQRVTEDEPSSGVYLIQINNVQKYVVAQRLGADHAARPGRWCVIGSNREYAPLEPLYYCEIQGKE